MVFSSDYFIIIYTNETQSLVELIEDALTVNMNKIIEFFGLEEISSKKEIIIYSSIDEYARHISKYSPYKDWMVADTFDGNLNVLSLEMCQRTRSHQKMEYEEYKKVILHEFVHLCQQEINPNAYGCVWFWEALATNLSLQVFDDVKITCTKEQLMFDYLNLVGNYAISYKLGKYMLTNLEHDLILEYIKMPEKLCNETEQILQTVKNLV